MGITKDIMEVYAKLVESGNLDFTSCKVIELGAQTVHFDDKNFFKKILKRMGIESDLADSFFFNMSSRFMHSKFNLEYYCIDLDGTKENIEWDLNVEKCSPEFRGKFDLCTNFGTTEHLIGQMNAFKMMHDLTKVGGIMFNYLPVNDFNHGFFNYCPRFFREIARHNDYKEVCYFAKTFTSTDLIELDRAENNNVFYVAYVCRKIKGGEFLFPYNIY